jgi:hypothetical protein
MENGSYRRGKKTLSFPPRQCPVRYGPIGIIEQKTHQFIASKRAHTPQGALNFIKGGDLITPHIGPTNTTGTGSPEWISVESLGVE